VAAQLRQEVQLALNILSRRIGQVQIRKRAVRCPSRMKNVWRCSISRDKKTKNKKQKNKNKKKGDLHHTVQKLLLCLHCPERPRSMQKGEALR
jgi:hypothetical protein